MTDASAPVPPSGGALRAPDEDTGDIVAGFDDTAETASVVAPVPRDRPDGPDEGPSLGRIEIAPRVVGKIASRAALEVDAAGGVGGGGIGRVLAGRSGPGFDVPPKSTAEVDGELAFVSLQISVRYPEPVLAVAAEVRERVRARLSELCGLDAVEVDIEVPTFVTHERPAPRVV